MRISDKELLAPLAAMYILDPHQEVQKGGNVSLKPLTEKVGIKDTLRKPGQLCGKMFRNGDPTYTCKYVIVFSNLVTVLNF